MDDIDYSIENDGLSPPKGSAPEHVDGAVGYEWDPVNQTWVPIFNQE